MPVTLDRGEAERLVHAYSDLILRLSYTYLKSTDDAQDICQTVFLKLLQKPQAFSSPEHEKAWIIRTAVNLCKDHPKKRLAARYRSPGRGGGRTRPPRRRRAAFSPPSTCFPPKYRTVIYLYYYEGYAAREIAQLLGEKPATVSTQLNRGRQQLRTLLESEGMT